MKVSKKDTKERIEKVLSEIFSDKYDMKITLKFVRRVNSGSENKSRIVREK